LSLLSETCDILLDPKDPRSHEESYQNLLKGLERSINQLSLSSSKNAASLKPSESIPINVEIYQIATLIYLVRASQSPWEPSVNLDSLVERAFSIPARGHICGHFFPLFILACEARREEHRALILNVIDRIDNDAHMRSIKAYRAEIQSFWAQQDLHADSDLVMNYLSVMSAVISSNNALLSYV
jgi:hypothetical protein